jgi:hypothetical protein
MYNNGRGSPENTTLHGRENEQHEETLGTTMVEAHQRRQPRWSRAQNCRLGINLRSDR